MSGGFVMVPDWLRAKQPSGNAILAYINLGSFGTFKPGPGIYDDCRPSVPRLVAEMGVSESTVKRAIAELVELGAAVKVRRFNRDGSPAPTLYRLIFGRVTADEGVGSPVNPPGSTHGPTVGSPVDGNQEPDTKNPPPIFEDSAIASSSSSATPPDDDDVRKFSKSKDTRQPKPALTEEQRQAKIEARKVRERAKAIGKVADRLGLDKEEAAALCDYLVEYHGARNLDSYVDGIDDDDLAERFAEMNDLGLGVRPVATPNVQARLSNEEIGAIVVHLTKWMHSEFRRAKVPNTYPVGEAIASALRRGASEDDVVAAFSPVPHPNTIHVENVYVPRLQALAA